MSKRAAAIRDLYPEVRVIIETQPAVYTASGAGGAYVKSREATLIEFREVTAVTATTGTSGSANGSITLASHRDSLHSKARRKEGRSERRQMEISEYLTEVLKLSSLTEINPRRRPLSPGQKRVFGVPVEKFGRLRQRMEYVLEAENGHISQSRGPKTRSEEYAGYEWFVADFQNMRRVWIDFRDRGRNWVAGMTGIITQIQDYYQVGEPPMVNISVGGMMRFWELSEYITQQAILGEQVGWPFETGAEQFPVQALSNTLAGQDAIEIAKIMADTINAQFSLIGAAANPSRRPEDFYYHDLILNVDDPESLGNAGSRINPRRTFESGVTTPDDLRANLIIDPQISRNDNQRLDVYRAAFRQAFQFYNFENTTPAQVMREAANATNYEWFEDPRGNMTLWAPRYDALPRVRGETGIPAADLGVAIGSGSAGGFTVPSLGLPRYGEDYSDLPYHDARYILDDVSMLGWNLTENEAAVKTFNRITNMPHLITLDENFQSDVNTGWTSYSRLAAVSEDLAKEVQRLARRFGIRRHTMPPIQTGSAFGERGLLDRLAYAHLVRLNAFAFAGTVNLEQRPELWGGRSVMLVERQRLGYITRVTNDFRPKQAHKTTLTLGYIHHPMLRIGIPWWEASDKQSAIPEIEGILG